MAMFSYTKTHAIYIDKAQVFMYPHSSKISIKTEEQQLHWGKEHPEKWNFSYDSCGSLTEGQG